ncbi:hypothetical protein Misp05_59780 [Micromonospora sp. NBRC 107095]|nr:hypothetical protein Misp05_59780 [Micromonospora sp. NBRC 107095]
MRQPRTELRAATARHAYSPPQRSDSDTSNTAGIAPGGVSQGREPAAVPSLVGPAGPGASTALSTVFCTHVALTPPGTRNALTLRFTEPRRDVPALAQPASRRHQRVGETTGHLPPQGG